MKEEQVGYEKDGQHNLQTKVERINEAYKQEIQTHKKENQCLRETLNQKDSMVAHLKNQVENFIQSANIEFPIVIQGVSGGTQPVQSIMSSSINLSN